MKSKNKHHDEGANCPTREQLRRYVLGRLDAHDIEQVSLHAKGCSRCQSILTELEALADPLTASLRRPGSTMFDVQSSELDELVLRLGALGKAGAEDPTTTLRNAPDVLDHLGDYQLIEKLGRGAMGVVYKARHIERDQVVALKVLAPHRLHNSRAVARFRREMQALESLDHPNIVQAYHAEKDGPWQFFTMELVEGVDLSRLVRWGGPLSTADACEVIHQAAIGLRHAHNNAIVHRDVKPSNLMLTTDGVIKVVDLGLARLLFDSPEDAPEAEPFPWRTVVPLDSFGTATGHVLGSRNYMAPEQKLNSRGADFRADIYSLGCTFYYLLTGTAPILNRPQENFLAYTASAPKLTLSMLVEQARLKIPRKLITLLDRMTESSPEHRPSTVAEVAEATEPFAAESDLVETYASRWSRSRSIVECSCAMLGVDATAPPKRIDEAYRRLVVENHPDLNPDDPAAAERFRRIQEAYETIREPERHRRKGAFHTAASAFLTVDVVTKSPRRFGEAAAGGIRLPLISMVVIFCIFMAVVMAILLFSAGEDDWTAADDSRFDETPASGWDLLGGIFCFVSLLFFVFIFVVLKHSGP